MASFLIPYYFQNQKVLLNLSTMHLPREPSRLGASRDGFARHQVNSFLLQQSQLPPKQGRAQEPVSKGGQDFNSSCFPKSLAALEAMTLLLTACE